MKKTITMLLIGIFMSSFSANIKAQDVLVVDPGVGTLNAAIDAHGANKIYQLKKGEWYQLTSIIENDGYHLQIIGEDPGEGMPATLQTNADAGGSVFARMFNAKGNITLKNIYFVNADLTGVIGDQFLEQAGVDARTIINNCVTHPTSNGIAVVLASGNNKLYFTDNLSIRMGHQLNPNCGHFFVTDGSGVGFDTLYVENNTFVAVGTNMHAGGFNQMVHNYSKWNHNTIIHQKSQIDWSNFEEEYYWTNNLMFDVQTQPWAVTWQPMPGSPASTPQPALIYADTIPGEALPTQRIQFVQYNLHYRNPKFYDLIEELNALAIEKEKPLMYLMPLIWPVDSADVARETAFFNDDTKFPNWKYGNTFTDVDPLFEDAKIYEHSDWFVKWTKPASMQHAMGLPASEVPPVTEWTQYHWMPDADISINDTWPVFNGRYTNPEILKASIEGLPLGDLNWFPEAKAIWEANKKLIDDHMRAGNEEKITLSGTSVNNLPGQGIGISIYPNPVKGDIITLSREADRVIVYNVTGSELISIRNVNQINVAELPNGIYLVRVQSNNEFFTHKVIIAK